MCSYQKYSQEIAFKNGGIVRFQNNWVYKLTSFAFEWALVTEITLTTLFWIYLYGFLTPTHEMTSQQIKEKLYFDIIVDLENYNHWVPLLLLMIESCFNNIPF